MQDIVYYWPFEPNRGFISDSNLNASDFELKMKLNGFDCILNLYCDDENHPWFAKVIIRKFDITNSPEAIQPILAMLSEHLRSVLILTYSPNIKYIPINLFDLKNVGETFKPTEMKLEKADKNNFSCHHAKELFAASLSFREELELFSEGFSHLIPLKYRFLSLYKLYERHYPKISDKTKVLESCEKMQSALSLNKTLRAEIEDVRDKCAHGIIGRDTKVKKGISSLSAADSVKIQTLLPIMLKVCSEAIKELSNGSCVFVGDLGWGMYAYKK